MSLIMKVECPRCKKVWNVHQGHPDIVCDCHLYCSDGDKPSDCSMTKVSFNDDLGWPLGLHVGSDTEGDDVMARKYYCSTHDKFSYKTPVLIPCDWESWFSKRAPKRLRMSHGQY